LTKDAVKLINSTTRNKANKVDVRVNGIPERINNPTLLDFDDLQNLINEGRSLVIQFVEPSYGKRCLKLWIIKSDKLLINTTKANIFIGYFGNVNQ
jgi:hypothetical protein